MSDRLDELGEKTDVVVVTFTEPERLGGYLATNDLPFPVLIDKDRAAYSSYGLARASLARVWGLRAARRYIQLFRQGGWRDLRRPVEDTRQLGGDFVVDPDGVLVYGFWGEGPDDRPSVDELIAAVTPDPAPA